MEYSYSEFVDNNNQTIKKGTARLISTSFVNYATPILRYDTGDLVEINENTKKCECGMNHNRITKLIGRDQDLIVDKDGNLITLTALIFGQHFKEFQKIEKFQVVQEKIGEIEIHIIPHEAFTNSDIE
jgi:phenylacetate-CoA ligase